MFHVGLVAVVVAVLCWKDTLQFLLSAGPSKMLVQCDHIHCHGLGLD